ncbi:MAG: sialidase family protein [Gammaproteobacteria bacterium]|nr:sialidase family protein [Gammaproteobacteria bacterium]MCY4166443.1 sialidase family protein [Gammaproteobacteria bacterium]MCY4254891.1 sialidase family protein [Gammaproteobacteria bacterium]
MTTRAYISLVSLLAALLLAPSMAWSEAAILYRQKLGRQDRAAFSPEIAVSHDGEVYVVWLDRDMPAGPPPKRKPGEHSHRSAVDLWIARSGDRGASFQAPSRVNQQSGVIWGFQVSKPRISTDRQGVVHIFYPANDVSTQTRLDVVASHYTQSTDKGATFSKPLTLNSHVNKDGRGLLGEELGAAHAFGTMAVAPDGAVHAFWLDTRYMDDPSQGATLFTASSRDGGATFASEIEFAKGAVCPCCQLVADFTDNESVLVSYRHVFEDGSRDSVVLRSNDRGATWPEPARLPIDPWYISGCPLKPTDMAVNDRYVYSVSYSAGPEHKGVWFSRSRNGALDFEKAMPVHPGSKYSDAPVITVTPSGVVRIVWHSREGRKSPYRLFMAESYDHGETFTDPWLLPTPEGDSRFPVISTAPDGTAHIAWEQRVNIGEIVTTEVHVMGVAAPVATPETAIASIGASGE